MAVYYAHMRYGETSLGYFSQCEDIGTLQDSAVDRYGRGLDTLRMHHFCFRFADSETPGRARVIQSCDTFL